MKQFVGEVVPPTEGNSPLGFNFLAQNCSIEGCNEQIVRLLTVPPQEIGRSELEFFHLDRCLNCSFFADIVSHEYDSSGNIIWSDPDIGDGAECLDLIADQCDRSSRASIRWRERLDSDVFDATPPLAGGSPIWEQSEEELNCPRCSRGMDFILQLSSSSMDPWRDANGFSIHDDRSTIKTRRWIGTGLEGFQITIEHYATVYLYFCFSCNVASNFTQTS